MSLERDCLAYTSEATSAAQGPIAYFSGDTLHHVHKNLTTGTELHVWMSRVYWIDALKRGAATKTARNVVPVLCLQEELYGRLSVFVDVLNSDSEVWLSWGSVSLVFCIQLHLRSM